MSWVDFFDPQITELKHQFGRGINSSPSEEEYELFTKSYEAFERKEILNAYMYFFKSIENFTNKQSNNNIVINKDREKLNFEIYQGSAKVTGFVTQKYLYAQVILLKKQNTHVALKRYFLEKNYQMTYVNYCTDSDFIKLKLYYDNTAMNPQKIFFPLREIALNADFDKEYIKSEFTDITLEDVEHIKALDEDELKIKYRFLQDSIDKIKNQIITLPSNDNAGMLSFIYLNILFEIDYLLVPKYEIYQKTSRKVQYYFSDVEHSTETKNEELKEYINKLQDMDFDEFKTKFYYAQYSFNPVERAPYEEIHNFIHESLSKIKWYKNNRHNQIIPTMYRYISFYILYNYGVHPVIKSLLHTLIEVQNPKYFQELGYDILYDFDGEIFFEKLIVTKIKNAITPYEKRFKSLKPFGDKLNFSSLNEFSNSYYLQINDLNFEEI